LQVWCVIGTYPAERQREQPLVVDVSLGLPTRRAARTKLRDTVDYVAVAGQISFLLRAGRFRLLEAAAEALAAALLAPPAPGEERAHVSRVRVRLTKPEALAAPTLARVSVARDSEWLVLGREDKEFGRVDVLYETSETGVYRLNIEPGKEIPLHVHERMQEHELVLTSGLLCQNEPVPPGTAFHWPLGAPHVYKNPTAVVQSVLCVDRPPFIPEDERVVSGAPAPVRGEAVW
jgi:dihydroneopterin aldolase